MFSSQRTRIRIILVTLVLLVTVVVSIFWHLSTINEKGTGDHCVGSTTITQAHAGSVPPLYLGLDAYRHLDKLSYLELGDRIAGQSTADLAGSNADNVHYLRVLPDGEHVLFDQLGPGIVTFMRMQENYGGPWKLSLDGRV